MLRDDQLDRVVEAKEIMRDILSEVNSRYHGVMPEIEEKIAEAITNLSLIILVHKFEERRKDEQEGSKVREEI